MHSPDRPTHQHGPASGYGSFSGVVAGVVVGLLLVLLSFQWIALAKFGGFTVRQPYPVLLLAIICVSVIPSLRAATLDLFAGSALWLVPFLIYLVAILPAFYGSIAQGSPIRQLVFAAGAIAIGGCLLALQDPRRALRLGGLFGILSFMVVTEIIGQKMGVGWSDAIAQFLAGNLDFVIYTFLRNIYNAAGLSEGGMMLASEKNVISASIFIAFVLFRAAGPRFRTDWLGMFMTAFTLFLLLMLNTRSVLLPLFLALMLVGLLPLFQRRSADPTRFLLGVTLGVLIIGASLPLLAADGPLMEMLRGRFALDDFSTTSRLTQLFFAMRHIEEAIWIGNGYMQVDEHPVHNLFLASFLHGGILPFLLTLIFYLVVLITWVRFVFRIATAPWTWRLPLRPEWVATLPLLPLIRVWLTGDAGHPAMAEWIALTSFQALCLANGMRIMPVQRNLPVRRFQ